MLDNIKFKALVKIKYSDNIENSESYSYGGFYIGLNTDSYDYELRVIDLKNQTAGISLPIAGFRDIILGNQMQYYKFEELEIIQFELDSRYLTKLAQDELDNIEFTSKQYLNCQNMQ